MASQAMPVSRKSINKKVLKFFLSMVQLMHTRLRVRQPTRLLLKIVIYSQMLSVQIVMCFLLRLHNTYNDS